MVGERVPQADEPAPPRRPRCPPPRDQGGSPGFAHPPSRGIERTQDRPGELFRVPRVVALDAQHEHHGERRLRKRTPAQMPSSRPGQPPDDGRVRLGQPALDTSLAGTATTSVAKGSSSGSHSTRRGRRPEPRCSPPGARSRSRPDPNRAHRRHGWAPHASRLPWQHASVARHGSLPPSGM